MARRKNRKVVEKGEAIDMKKYIDSKPVVEQCAGCTKIFDFVWQVDTVTMMAKKCLAYINPKAKWGTAPAVMKEVTARIKGDFVTEMLPVIDTGCPLATHTEARTATDTQKVRVGQQKQKSKA